MDDDQEDLDRVTTLLRSSLDTERGKLRVSDALLLAGFERRSFVRDQIVGRAMRNLGWERGRYRFDGTVTYAYAKGTRLQRENILEVMRGEDGQLIVKRRAP